MATDPQRSKSRHAAAWGGAAGIALLAVLAGYHKLLDGWQLESKRIAFVSAYILTLSILAFVAAGCLIANRPAPARRLLMGTASGAVFLGIPGIFSIGPALFVAAAVQLVAAGRVPSHPRERRAWVVTLGLLILPPLALAAGFDLTSQ